MTGSPRKALGTVAKALSALAMFAALAVVAAIVLFALLRSDRTPTAEIIGDMARVLTGPFYSLFPLIDSTAFAFVNWGLAAVTWVLIALALRAAGRRALG